MKVCEFGEFKAGVKRCRKRARQVVGYKQLFGHQVGPHGDTPIYQVALTYRCEDHQATAIPGPIVGQLTTTEYARRIAAQPS